MAQGPTEAANLHRDPTVKRSVGAELQITAHSDCEVELQIAVATTPGLIVEETLSLVHESTPVTAVAVNTAHHGRLHLLSLPAGVTRIHYSATVHGAAEAPASSLADLSLYRRPSRYVESDIFGGFAHTEFRGIQGAELLDAVSSWVGTRLDYVPGSSGPTDGAKDTLLKGAGVCRDYAHLVIALLRALRVPARLVAVYAPGCHPMDFHAVAEAHIDGTWHVVDATALAPRTSLIRLATGRDAADVAFLTFVSGYADLDRSVVTSVADNGLPGDDFSRLAVIS
ncbi:hypothetical protein ABIE44_003013 [Marmoricola sp. OAE513]|uniref:transglutaminase-like domain-containing protein n=1 Tax=Marmoricola sp. OAE513 TaxID=2817894 RepID=UPI001AE2CFA0